MQKKNPSHALHYKSPKMASLLASSSAASDNTQRHGKKTCSPATLLTDSSRLRASLVHVQPTSAPGGRSRRTRPHDDGRDEEEEGAQGSVRATRPGRHHHHHHHHHQHQHTRSARLRIAASACCTLLQVHNRWSAGLPWGDGEGGRTDGRTSRERTQSKRDKAGVGLAAR